MLRALLSNHLIALDKSPGTRPISIGKTLQRIISKTICLVAQSDAEVICGSDQLCPGIRSGIEAAIHAVNDLFQLNNDDR